MLWRLYFDFLGTEYRAEFRTLFSAYCLEEFRDVLQKKIKFKGIKAQ
jgi:hypothetical protein